VGLLHCPKCRGLLWLEDLDREVVLKCLCGFLKFVEISVPSGGTITHKEGRSPEWLPRKGTKLHRCLMVVFAEGVVKTAEVASRLQQSSSETATQLAVLCKVKGLVRVTENRRGLPGGSVWELTDLAKKALLGELK
jgi:hypothetical protein